MIPVTVFYLVYVFILFCSVFILNVVNMLILVNKLKFVFP